MDFDLFDEFLEDDIVFQPIIPDDLLTLLTNHTPAVLAPIPPGNPLIDQPVAAEIVRSTALVLFFGRLLVAHANLFGSVTSLRPLSEEALAGAVWLFQQAQLSLPPNLRREVEDDFVIAGNNPVIDLVTSSTFRCRARVRLGSLHYGEPLIPNAEDLTDAERERGYGYLRRDANGVAPTPTIIRNEVLRLLEDGRYLHSGRLDESGHLIVDFQNPHVYGIVGRTFYQGQLSDEMERISSGFTPAQRVNSFTRRVPMGALLYAATGACWLLDCRRDAGTRSEKQFSRDIYLPIFKTLRQRYMFLRQDPAWAARDDHFRTQMADVFMGRAPGFNLLNIPNLRNLL
ncbi:hypothetical protein BV25DRAFT_1922538 [Artomyces pyxidatus]|uniref:Uncharacterized protein n=1 Tax=Artomyces pyxidatus TaxID=48021 RepID=A0ACB8SFY3_9AGAM|nr:hypothetical protein BV25DRAFT_1922538 [Artomyces pyxidatus]